MKLSNGRHPRNPKWEANEIEELTKSLRERTAPVRASARAKLNIIANNPNRTQAVLRWIDYGEKRLEWQEARTNLRNQMSPPLEGEDATRLVEYIENPHVPEGHAETMAEAKEIFKNQVSPESANSLFEKDEE